MVSTQYTPRPYVHSSRTAQSVTLHTTHGDLKIEVFCEAVPRAAENFLALCASQAYDDCLFHRNIRNFMVQTGDPTGTGKGGQSIWGAPFPDEVRATLKVSSFSPRTVPQQRFFLFLPFRCVALPVVIVFHDHFMLALNFVAWRPNAPGDLMMSP